MNLDRFNVNNVPFPYFILDQQLKVVKKSQLAERNLPHTDFLQN